MNLVDEVLLALSVELFVTFLIMPYSRGNDVRGYFCVAVLPYNPPETSPCHCLPYTAIVLDSWKITEFCVAKSSLFKQKLILKECKAVL